ncbi:YciI family protein [Tenggerimyces flavus]|uniref:YciI family protein n=1 Tax=Tenggerimyces flavus TaxID=1708749 RepID=A0ABV7YB94_9ACTN|nr:YciI family protein [Tenggerimyces flavus]MBM7786543.1 hypothetical protein [Tenggerimyces flavus]
MTTYLLSLHQDSDESAGETGEPMSSEEREKSWRDIEALNEELRSADAWVFGGALHDSRTATVVRVAKGDVLTTDGPFAEGKEHLGGFYIIRADDLDAALVWASKAAAATRKPIEVRPFRAADS